MTTRESLHEFVERLSDREVVELWEELMRTRKPGVRLSGDPVDFVDALRFPALAAAWDNDDDSIFDQL